MCRTPGSDRYVSKDARCGGNCPGMPTGNQAARSCARPQASSWQIWNMCCGFLGLQFGFALQNANVSRIFQTLGAPLEQVPLLWIAAPLTGLLVQPIVGYLSDRTWTRLGRRRPYFLAGALASSLALVLMPRSPGLWVAAGLLWILDGAINVAMEAFREFVGDQVPAARRPAGCAASTGPGALLPPRPSGRARRLYLLFCGALLWGLGQSVYSYGLRSGPLGTLMSDLAAMPLTMRRLAPVQFFSWLALFAMWIYTTAAVAQVHFGASDPHSDAYNRGPNWVGVLFAAYNGFAALASAVIPVMARRFGLQASHLLNLWAGGAALLCFPLFADPHWLLLPMLGVGLAWGSILSLPYALLSTSVPAEKMGVYMGIFNFFIVIPQLVAATVLGLLLRILFGGAPIYALVMGGVSLVLAGALVLRVPQPAGAARG